MDETFYHSSQEKNGAETFFIDLIINWSIFRFIAAMKNIRCSFFCAFFGWKHISKTHFPLGLITEREKFTCSDFNE